MNIRIILLIAHNVHYVKLAAPTLCNKINMIGIIASSLLVISSIYRSEVIKYTDGGVGEKLLRCKNCNRPLPAIAQFFE